MNWEKFWDKIDERYRYITTIIWMNTIGLIVDIVLIVKSNRKINNDFAREENKEELRKSIAKLLIFLGAICLAVYWIWLSSIILLIIALALIVLGICGRIAQGIGRFIDEVVS